MMRMILFVYIILPTAFSNPLPQDLVAYDALSFQSNTGSGSDIDTEAVNGANPDSLVLAKSVELDCARGLQYACCDSAGHPAYKWVESGGYTKEELEFYGVYSCTEDKPDCSVDESYVRRCCREDGKASFSFNDGLDHFYLTCTDFEA